jgi:mono/diheme cytochrome c family protein
MRANSFACLVAAPAFAAALAVVHAAEIPLPKPKPDKERIERGRYLAIVGGCNDCHTLGYAESEGQLPERGWLSGNPVGFRGFWGTTYGTNLRRSLGKITEDEWVRYATGLETRPPMPWFNLNQWSEEDLRSFYHFVRQLGPIGKAAPDPVPPDDEPKTPVVTWPMPSAVGR